jgi:hypothetical protein
MTDGIIQKVLRSWKKEFPYYIPQIEQELMAEIKEAFDDKGFLSHHTETLKILIGDNQE